MKLAILAVGKLKDDEAKLCARYTARITALSRSTGLGPLSVIEIAEARAGAADERRRAESAGLLRRKPEDFSLIALDEHGPQHSSAEFAAQLCAWRDDGLSGVAFAIGGADGHGDEVRITAVAQLSLSCFTLPHGLARIVLAEQLYRAATIAAGHPYHRV